VIWVRHSSVICIQLSSSRTVRLSVIAALVHRLRTPSSVIRPQFDTLCNENSCSSSSCNKQNFVQYSNKMQSPSQATKLKGWWHLSLNSLAFDQTPAYTARLVCMHGVLANVPANASTHYN